jgi:hypothetical protein
MDLYPSFVRISGEFQTAEKNTESPARPGKTNENRRPQAVNGAPNQL